MISNHVIWWNVDVCRQTNIISRIDSTECHVKSHVHIGFQTRLCFVRIRLGSHPNQISNLRNEAASNYNSVLFASGGTRRPNARRSRKNTSLQPIRNPINLGTYFVPVRKPSQVLSVSKQHLSTPKTLVDDSHANIDRTRMR